MLLDVWSLLCWAGSWLRWKRGSAVCCLVGTEWERAMVFQLGGQAVHLSPDGCTTTGQSLEWEQKCRNIFPWGCGTSDGDRVCQPRSMPACLLLSCFHLALGMRALEILVYTGCCQ